MNKHKGFTVVEVLIAVLIMMITLGAAIMTIRSSVAANQDALDYGLARSLAEDSLETMKNLRDSNWFKFSAYKDNCWNYWAEADPDGDAKCENTNGNDSKINKAITGTMYYYTLHIHPNNKNIVLKADGSGSLNSFDPQITNPEYYRIGKAKIVDSTLLDALLFVNYNNLLVSDKCESGITTNCYQLIEQTKFYRAVGVEIAATEPDVLKLSSIVWWYDKGEKKEVKLGSYLTNYWE